MKLDNFEAVYATAEELFLKGESLVCEGDGVTVSVRHVPLPSREIEVMYFDAEAHKHHTRRFNSINYPDSGLESMKVATRYLRLLGKGGNYGD
jgi:hypothetical protein